MEIDVLFEEGQRISPGQLDRELRAELGENFLSLSFYGPKRPLRLYFEDGTATEVFDAADAIVAAHVPGPEEPQPLSLEKRVAALEREVEELKKGKA